MSCFLILELVNQAFISLMSSFSVHANRLAVRPCSALSLLSGQVAIRGVPTSDTGVDVITKGGSGRDGGGGREY